MGIKVKNGEIIRGNTPLSKNEEEAINNYEKAMEDVKPFEMRQYERFHPEAVKDVEKARAMAEAGEQEETIAAELTKKAIEKVRNMTQGEAEMTDARQTSLDMTMGAAASWRDEAHKKEEEAGKRYDEKNPVE